MKVHKKKRIEESELQEEDLDGVSFAQYELYRVYAKGLTFRGVSFKQAIIGHCYFRNCTFVDCDFTGAEVTQTNMQGTSFTGCTFNYTSFQGTNVGLGPIADNLPAWENVKMQLAKSLRMNYASVGDYDGVNFAIRIELAATMEHRKKAAFSREAYYRRKPEYSGMRRILCILQYLWFWMLDRFWGNGEYPLRMLLSVPVTLVVGSILIALQSEHTVPSAGKEVFEVFVFGGESAALATMSAASVNLFRLLVIGMFVSSLVRRLSRR